jgi:hypothetical protein
LRVPSLFAHLVQRFTTHPENLATEALAYVLGESPSAGSALQQFASIAQPGIERPKIWRTQLPADDDSTPDLVGTDQSGAPVIILEAKFWAALTRHQPVSYLKQLPSDRSGLVLVVAPAVRLDSLWNELLQRTRDSFTTGNVVHTAAEYRHVALQGGHALGLCSWRTLLDHVAVALTSSGDVAAGADLAQLSAMCEVMDTTAFLPLHPEELSGATGARILHYIDLVKAAANDLKDRVDVSGMDQKGKHHGFSYGEDWSGSYLNLAGWGCMLRFSAGAWCRSGLSPIWLQVGYDGQPTVAKIEAALKPLAVRPGKIVPVAKKGFVDVAIELPVGTERHQVVASIVRQVTEVQHLIQQA